MCKYVKGKYDEDESFQKLTFEIEMHEKEVGDSKEKTVRIFYLALPPSTYIDVTKGIKNNCYLQGGINKVIIEKPFGKDTESCQDLVRKIGNLFKEDEVI